MASQVAFGQEQNEASTTPPWPRKFVSGSTTALPLSAAARKVAGQSTQHHGRRGSSNRRCEDPSYGVVWFDARTEVDKINREVTLLDYNFTKSNFPTASNNGQDYVNILKQQMSKQFVMSLDQLEADLDLTDAQIATQQVPLQNNPPQILFSTKPAVLVLIDGQPALRPVEKSKLQRVINTRSLILFDKSKNLYYLQLMDGWMESPSVEGGWLVSKKAPKDGDKIKAQLVANQTDHFA